MKGIIRWNLVAPDEYTGHGDVRLVVTFPEFYPYLRPDVTAPDLDMPHHQHPFGKNLCLIGRASSAWDTSNDVGWLIREQLKKALVLGQSNGRGGDEENQGEPFSDYYQYGANAMVLVDSAWAPRAGAAGGSATLRVTGPKPGNSTAPSLFAVTTIKESHGTQEFAMPTAVAEQFKECEEWTARWNHIEAPIKTLGGAELWKAVEDADTSPVGAPVHPGTDSALRLVSFSEEHSQEESGTGWILLMRQLGQWMPATKKDRNAGNPARRSPRREATTYHVVRSGRIGTTDMRARTGTDSALSSKRVLLIGAGAVGSVIADQLARAGVGALTVIDHDVLEPGNLVRHASNLAFVGAHKSDAAVALATHANPYIEVQSHQFPVGGMAFGTGQRRILAEEYDRAHLIIDATAEVGVQRLTASLAKQAGKPWIAAWGTNGARGGVVVRVPPDAAWCFACFEWTRSEDERLLPPASPAPLTQPIGCAEPTFVGSGYDLNEIAIHGTRTAVAALLQRPTHDVAVLTLEHSSGADLPRWDVFPLSEHLECSHR